jgi:cation diffusion facilitator family transporter
MRFSVHPEDMTHEHAGMTGHGHHHGSGHEEADRPGLLARIARIRLPHALRPHSHAASGSVDAAMETSVEGMRTLWISLAVLAGTAALQAAVVVFSGSVALLGDTLHNAADALTAVPLGIAFGVGRRPPTRRYTYGYGRAEDLAGVAITGVIAASSVLTAAEAVSRLAHPHRVSALAAVAIAALIGFAGNELAARYRITTGRRIGSAALVADGLHARTDGFTSLAVLPGAGGAALGWQWADPVAGLLITVAIMAVLWQAARDIWQRLMDAVDPALVTQAEQALLGAPGVLGVGHVRLRWTGHQLRAEAEVIVGADITAVEAHQATVSAERALLRALPRLSAAMVHADPSRHEEAGGSQHGAVGADQPRASERTTVQRMGTSPGAVAVVQPELPEGKDLSVPAYQLADHGAGPARVDAHGHVQPPRVAVVQEDLPYRLMAGRDQRSGTQQRVGRWRGGRWRGGRAQTPASQA